MTTKQLDYLAEELRERTCHILNEELYTVLHDAGYIEELDDDAIDLHNAVLKRFFHSTITKHW